MRMEYKVKLTTAFKYYKTMVSMYGLEHGRTRKALLTLIQCYRSRFKPENSVLGLVKGFECEGEETELIAY
jgi:hypothetical protein